MAPTPPQSWGFSSNNVSGVLDTRKDAMKKTLLVFFRFSVFQKIRPAAGLKDPAISLKTGLRGDTVQRLFLNF